MQNPSFCTSKRIRIKDTRLLVTILSLHEVLAKRYMTNSAQWLMHWDRATATTPRFREAICLRLHFHDRVRRHGLSKIAQGTLSLFETRIKHELLHHNLFAISTTREISARDAARLRKYIVDEYTPDPNIKQSAETAPCSSQSYYPAAVYIAGPHVCTFSNERDQHRDTPHVAPIFRISLTQHDSDQTKARTSLASRSFGGRASFLTAVHNRCRHPGHSLRETPIFTM